MPSPQGLQEQDSPPKDEVFQFGQSTPLPPTSKSEPAEKPMSVGGWIENALNDGLDFVKGIVQILPSTYRAYKEFFSTPGAARYAYENPSEVLDAFRVGGGAIKDAILEPYQKYGVKVLYHKPITVLSDAVAVATLGGSSASKAGQLTKAAAKLAGFAEDSAVVAKADKLIEFGNALQELPGKYARKAVDEAVYQGTGGKLDLAKRREFLDIKREELAGASERFGQDAEKVGKLVGDLSDPEAEMFHKARVFGDAEGYGVPLDALRANPKVAAALGEYRKLANQVWKDRLQRTGLLTEETANEALGKKFAAEAFGSTSEEAVAKAQELIGKSRLKPTYGPALFDKKRGLVLEDFLKVPSINETGKVGQLEEFTGAQGAVKDPRIYVPQAMQNFRKLEAKLRTVERTIETPGLIKAPGRGGTSFADEFAAAKQTRNAPQGIFQKYFDDKVRAQAMAQVTDPTIKRLLRWEFTGFQHPLLKVYDRFVSLFKSTATALNPRWYTGNAVGDAVLGTLAGSDWKEGKALRAAMPPEITAKAMRTQEIGAPNRLLEKAYEIGSSFDEAAKAGVIAKGVARDMKRAGLTFEGTAASMEDVLRSTRSFSGLQVEMRLLEENIAQKSIPARKLDIKIAELQQKEAALVRQADMYHTPAKLQDIRQQIQNLVTQRDAVVGDLLNDTVKSGELERRIPALRQQVDIVRKNVNRANAFMADYLGLDGFEQGVMRRLVPFYGWMKAMTLLAYRLPFLAPVKSFMWNRYSMALWSMVGDPELPEYMKGYVPVFARGNGDTVWLSLGTYSPWSSTRITKFAGVPIPNLLAFQEQNPVITLAMKYAGYQTVFDHGAVPYGEPLVRATDGSIWEYTQNGMWKKTQNQTPFVSGLVHMFPITQLIESIMAPSTLNTYNWLGYPEPMLKPDGSYKYPNELWNRIGVLLGGKLINNKREDLIRAEKSRVLGNIKELQKRYSKASPEERETIKETLRDYMKGEYRRIDY